MTTKFITITNNGFNEDKEVELFENCPVYRIYNNKTKDQLGIISYFKKWKKYVFSTKGDIIFDLVCLQSIVDFMSSL